ncbi:MAG: hypothetical protein ACLSCE_14310 [Bacteroides cellulosilyticus]
MFAVVGCYGWRRLFLYPRLVVIVLIEAEERIETLNRLLADATKGDSEPGTTGNVNQEVEDGQFFRKILLQQLGIIRLVATQPTSQNQDLLRRISGHHEPASCR